MVLNYSMNIINWGYFRLIIGKGPELLNWGCAVEIV